MIDSVKFLSDDALVKVAAYYASLDPAQPAETGAPAIVDPVQAGKTAAAACAGCHGEAGVSNIPGIPNLIGEEPQYLVAAMKDYRSGQRKNDTMKAMVAALADAEMSHIALFYALQKPARAQTPAQGDAEAGKAASPSAAPGAMATRGSAAIPRRRAWPARTRRTSPARWRATRTRPAATRRWRVSRLRSTKPR